MEQWEIDLRKRLEVELADGLHQIGTGKFRAYTGKLGMINYLVEVERKLRNYKPDDIDKTILRVYEKYAPEEPLPSVFQQVKNIDTYGVLTMDKLKEVIADVFNKFEPQPIRFLTSKIGLIINRVRQDANEADIKVWFDYFKRINKIYLSLNEKHGKWKAVYSLNLSHKPYSLYEGTKFRGVFKSLKDIKKEFGW